MKKILIIDDEFFVHRILGKALQQAGYTVDVAANGKEGLEKLFSNDSAQPDLILLDILMPGIDGYEVLEKLSAQKNGERPKVVVLSAFNQQEQIKKALSLGADDFWVKSELNVGNIVDRINKKLGKK